jgi:hypothetical protein
MHYPIRQLLSRMKGIWNCQQFTATNCRKLDSPAFLIATSIQISSELHGTLLKSPDQHLLHNNENKPNWLVITSWRCIMDSISAIPLKCDLYCNWFAITPRQIGFLLPPGISSLRYGLRINCWHTKWYNNAQ